MADKTDGNIFSFLKFYDQFNDRLLYRYIQCGSCLIKNQNLRFQSQSTGDGYIADAVRRTYCADNGLQNLPAALPFQKTAAGCILLTLPDTVKVQKRFAYNITDLHFGLKEEVGS